MKHSPWLIMSGCGTKRTCRADLIMSVDRGRPEEAFGAVRTVFDPTCDKLLHSITSSAPTSTPTSSAKRPLVAYCNDARLPSGGASDGTVDQMLRLRRARPITRSD
jgi:hypothetical protein